HWSHSCLPVEVSPRHEGGCATMFCNLERSSTLLSIALVLAVAAPRAVRAQAQPRSSVPIPIRKEQRPVVRVDTVHDTVTVTVVRVDTVRVVESTLRVDTLVRVDTLRDSCSRGILPIPIPVPLPRGGGHGGVGAEAAMVAPEPDTLVLVGTGISALVALSHFRRKK